MAWLCSRDIFSKKEAESWWTENGDRVRAVYNVPAFERSSTNEHAVATSEEEVKFRLHLMNPFCCEHHFISSLFLCEVSCPLMWVKSTPERTVRDDELQLDGKFLQAIINLASVFDLSGILVLFYFITVLQSSTQVNIKCD